MGMLTFEVPKESALAGVSFSLIGKHVGRQFLDNTSNVDRSLDAFTTLDAVVRVERDLASGQQVTLSVFGNNLTDALYSATGWTYSYRYEEKVLKRRRTTCTRKQAVTVVTLAVAF